MPSQDFNNTDCFTSSTSRDSRRWLERIGEILTLCAGLMLVATAIMSVYRSRRVA